MCHMSCVSCQVSGVRCRVSGIRCQVSHALKRIKVKYKFWYLSSIVHTIFLRFSLVVCLLDFSSILLTIVLEFFWKLKYIHIAMMINWASIYCVVWLYFLNAYLNEGLLGNLHYSAFLEKTLEYLESLANTMQCLAREGSSVQCSKSPFSPVENNWSSDNVTHICASLVSEQYYIQSSRFRWNRQWKWKTNKNYIKTRQGRPSW